MAWHGRKPKATKGDQALARTLNVRLTPAQHAAYAALGGVEWLRRTLSEAKPLETLLPAAHNPFPAFTVANAKTGEPVPHTVTVREY